MKKKFIWLLCLSMVLVSLLSGCSSKSAQKDTKEPEQKKEEVAKASNGEVTVTFWHSMGGVNGKAIDHLVEEFNAQNKGKIKVVAQYQGEYDDAINKLKSAQIGNMGADLVQIYDIGTRFMIDSGWIVPMQELIDKDKYDISQIEPNIAAYYTVGGKLYSMPFNSSTPIMYYNKDMFQKAGIEKVPTNFQEIEAISKALTEKGGAGEPISLGIYGWFFEQFLCKQGLDYVDNGNGRTQPATKIVFDQNGGGLAILKEWKNLYDKKIAPNVGRGGDSGISDFTAGKSAITLGSTASLKQILMDVNGKFQVGTAFLPGMTENSKGGVSIGGASLWALKNNDPAKEKATWEFVKFLVAPKQQAYWNAETGYFPITTKAHEEPVFKENIAKYPQFMTAIDQLHASNKQSAGALLSVFPEARQIIEGEIEDMLNNNRTPQDTLKTIAEKINKAISDYNKINS